MHSHFFLDHSIPNGSHFILNDDTNHVRLGIPSPSRVILAGRSDPSTSLIISDFSRVVNHIPDGLMINHSGSVAAQDL